MNATKVLDRIKRVKPNSLQDEDLLIMLNDLEKVIASEVVYKDYVEITTSNMTTELLAPDNYGKIYFEYIASQIDYLNGDIQSYSISSRQFNDTYGDMQNYCIKHGITPPIEGDHQDYY